MASLLQPSFAGGELAPSLQGRVDLARYAISLRTCRNFIVLPYGGVATRPGLRFVAAAKHADKKCRLLEFTFNTEQTYIIEMGDGYARFHKDGAPVMDGGSPVEVATPWAEADLSLIKTVQSADVLTLLHPEYAPRELSRTSATSFSLATYKPQLGPFRDQNVDESITVSANAVTGSVTLTASSGIFSSEHVGTLVQLRQVDMGEVSAWQNRADVTVGDKRYVDERVYEATELSATASNTLTGDNTPAHTEGEQWDGPQATVQGITDTLGVKWKYLHSGVGVVEITGFTNSTTVTGTVAKRLPDTVVSGNTYRWSLAAWDGVRGYPGTATYYQQRLVLGGSIAQPQTFWMSETGIFDGFETNLPLEADDAISFTLASRQVNEIRHLVPLGALLALTSGAEWQIASGDKGLAPDTVEASVQGYRGTSHLPPLLIGSSALYVQARGTIVRDLTYSFELDGYAGDDLTVFSNHLFRGFTLDDWAYSQEPNSLVWAVRSDGALLSMTYVREQQVVAWARHDSAGGTFESVASVSEGAEDALYAVVNRAINGSTVRYIERLESREFDDLEDYFGVDAGLTYDGRNTTATTLTLSGGTEWKTDETLVLTSSVATFTAGVVGRRFRLTSGDTFADVEVTAFTSDTVVSVEPVRLVPEALHDTATADWALMATTLSGLDHLEGETVSIAADGNAAPSATVVSGSITLATQAAVAHVGLPIESDLETLPINQTTKSGDNLRGNVKNVPAVGLVLHRSRGVFVGRDRNDFAVENNLIELKQRDDEDWAESTSLLTGYTRLAIPTGWDQDGRVFVRQADPLPLTILSIIPEVQLGGKG
jgi:hypothetical protein